MAFWPVAGFIYQFIIPYILAIMDSKGESIAGTNTLPPKLWGLLENKQISRRLTRFMCFEPTHQNPFNFSISWGN